MAANIEQLRRSFEIRGHSLRQVRRDASDVGGYIVERLVYMAGDDETVRGILTRPLADAPAPAILYIHAHGGRYDIGAAELLDGRPALQEPLGPVFAAMGFAALAVDMPGFGSRADRSESELAKARLWRGKSLAGQMLGEQAAALGWLAAQPFVDAGRIGCFGISMGATLGYWLAAVDGRIAALAHLCCYADFSALIELGAHDRHGIYLTIPGLLNIASNGEIAGLVAPRPQLICVGDLDPLTPPGAVDRALAQTRTAYERAGATDQLSVHREAETGHQESPEMRRAVLEFFRRTLL
jgi:dienelactone hydrolase